MRWLRWFARAPAERRTIRQLRALDDHLLRDIGIERGDIPRTVAALLDGQATGWGAGRVTTFRARPGADTPVDPRPAAAGAPAPEPWRPSAEGVR